MNQLSIICIGLEQLEIIATIRSFISFNNISDVFIVSPKRFELSLQNLKFRVHYIRDNKSGIYEAMNLGLHAVHSQTFMIVNAGDYLDEDKSRNALFLSEPNSIMLFISKKNILWRIYVRLNLRQLIHQDQFAKFILRLGFMPCSHQNIVYPNISKDHLFSHKYRLSADFAHLYDEIFKYNRSFKVIYGSIGRTSRGGVSDTKRSSVILERIKHTHTYNPLTLSNITLGIYLISTSISELIKTLKQSALTPR